MEAGVACELLEDVGQDMVPLSCPFIQWILFFFEQNGASCMVKPLKRDNMPIINPLISDFPRVSFFCRPIWQQVTSDSISGFVQPFRFTETIHLAPLDWLVS